MHTIRSTGLLVATLVVLLVTAPAGEARAEDADYNTLPSLTLQDALNRARAHSPQLKASKEKIVQAQAQVRMAYTLLLPFVNVTGSYSLADKEIKIDFGGMTDLYVLAAMNCAGWDVATMGPAPSLCDTPPETDTDTSSSSSANVIQSRHNWDGAINVGISLLNARTFPQIKNVYTGRELAQLQDRFTEENLLFAVVQLYYGVATAQSAVDLLTDNLAIARANDTLLKARETAQVALPNERIRFDMVLIRAEDGLAGALLGLDYARRSLGILMGQDEASFKVAAGEAPEAPNGEQPDSATLGRRLDIQMMDKAALMAERAVTDIWMQFVPTLTAVWNGSATSNTGFSGENFSWRAMVALEWNVFAGGVRFAQLDQARSKVREARYNRDAALLQARTQVESARQGILDAQRSLRSGERFEALASQNRDLVRKQYELGVADQTLLLDSDREHLNARIQLIQARLRLTLATISWSKSVGAFLERVESL